MSLHSLSFPLWKNRGHISAHCSFKKLYCWVPVGTVTLATFEGKCRSDTFYPRVYHLVFLIQESWHSRRSFWCWDYSVLSSGEGAMWFPGETAPTLGWWRCRNRKHLRGEWSFSWTDIGNMPLEKEQVWNQNMGHQAIWFKWPKLRRTDRMTSMMNSNLSAYRIL